ncbi:hypothetical protein B0H19DRAFT_1324155, partial [Mycena capillaripes]
YSVNTFTSRAAFHVELSLFGSVPSSQYDLLHFDESGKWGHHLWPLILDLLGELRLLTEMTDIHLTQRVSEDHGKRFRFPKQHFIVHALQDIRSKGVLRNATTRTGEGFHQEIAQHYRKTNFREAEGQQIANEDEDQEAIARTRLIVDDFFRHLNSESGDDNEAMEDTTQFKQKSGRRIPRSKLSPASRDNQWIFGSVLRCGDSRSYEDLHAGENPAYRSFDPRLRDFLHGQFPTEYLTAEDRIEVETFQCVYIAFQSNDDWSESEDILRCNHNWYKSGPRYDCVLFNQDDPGLACASVFTHPLQITVRPDRGSRNCPGHEEK